jgi:hypothetical protein
MYTLVSSTNKTVTSCQIYTLVSSTNKTVIHLTTSNCFTKFTFCLTVLFVEETRVYIWQIVTVLFVEETRVYIWQLVTVLFVEETRVYIRQLVTDLSLCHSLWIIISNLQSDFLIDFFFWEQWKCNLIVHILKEVSIYMMKCLNFIWYGLKML